MSTNPMPPQPSSGAQHPLALLDVLFSDSPRKRVGTDQVLLILDALAGATDSALVERFPAVLAVCARSGIGLDGQALLSRYWESSPKRQNLEQLLLISDELLTREKMASPGNVARIAIGLRNKYPSVVASGRVTLSTGVLVTTDGLRRALGQVGLLEGGGKRLPAPVAPAISPEVSRQLERLFSPKQLELVLKRLDNRPMTKTEREYYSRSAKKKLEAISNETVQRIAQRLLAPSARKREE